MVKAKGNGLKPVSGQCSTSSEPPSRRLSEIPDGHSSSSTDGPAPLDEQQHRRLAEAPPLSRTSDSTSSHSSKRLTAAAFFTPDSTPEYEGSSAGSTSFSDQDLTELLEEEKSKATATGKGTEEPNNHAESQDESAPETKTAAADISTGPHTDHKAKQNEKKLDRECRKAYEARMFSQSKPIFPGPVYSQVPVVRLPRPLTMPDVPSAPCQSIMSSSDTLQDAEQRQVSLLVGSKRHGQEPRPREPKRQRREPPSDRKIDPRDYRRLMKLQREYPSQRRMRGDSWRPRYDEWGWEL